MFPEKGGQNSIFFPSALKKGVKTAEPTNQVHWRAAPTPHPPQKKWYQSVGGNVFYSMDRCNAHRLGFCSSLALGCPAQLAVPQKIGPHLPLGKTPAAYYKLYNCFAPWLIDGDDLYVSGGLGSRVMRSLWVSSRALDWQLYWASLLAANVITCQGGTANSCSPELPGGTGCWNQQRLQVVSTKPTIYAR